jgi:hypothetical protein
MRRKELENVWNPFAEVLDGLSMEERSDRERARAWTCYLNGGGGEPQWFDRPALVRNHERQRER